MNTIEDIARFIRIQANKTNKMLVFANPSLLNIYLEKYSGTVTALFGNTPAGNIWATITAFHPEEGE